MATATTLRVPTTRDLPGLLGLIFLLACLTVVSTFSVHRLPSLATLPTTTKAVFYSTTIAVEWILVGYAAWRLRHLGLSIKTLVNIPSTLRGWLIDIGVTVGFFAAWAAVGQGLSHFLKPGTPGFSRLLPSNRLEITLWILLSLSAGFCEELVFRGYLQRVLQSATNAAFAIVTQGVIFGLVHFYQGVKLVTLIIVLGTMLGFLAHWRRKLWPGMMFHAVTDIVGAVFR